MRNSKNQAGVAGRRVEGGSMLVVLSAALILSVVDVVAFRAMRPGRGPFGGRPSWQQLTLTERTLFVMCAVTFGTLGAIIPIATRGTPGLIAAGPACVAGILFAAAFVWYERWSIRLTTEFWTRMAQRYEKKGR